MEYSLANSMVIGVSARALFDMRKENSIFEQQGLAAYTAYQKAHEDEILRPGPAFALIKALLQLNSMAKRANRATILTSPYGFLTLLKAIGLKSHAPYF